MEFNKGIYFKVIKIGWVYRLDAPINVFSKPAWICFRLPTGNVIEARFIFFEENLETNLQNHDIEFIKG